MHLSPDEIIFWQYGFVKLNATILYTWLVMLLLVIGARLVTRKLEVGLQRAHWQNFLEIIVIGMNRQIAEIGLDKASRYLPFLGTLFPSRAGHRRLPALVCKTDFCHVTFQCYQ